MTSPTLAAERAYLAAARADLRAMREATLALDARGGDAVSEAYLASSLHKRVLALADDPETPLFFGRLDLAAETDERFYVGRRHVHDDAGDPVVIDWRADVSTAFYRATRTEPMDVVLRRRFGFERGEITAYEDEHLLDRTEAETPQRDSCRRDRAPSRRPDARHRRHHPARAGRHRPRRRERDAVRAGRPGHRQDRGRPAPRGVPALHVPRPAAARRRTRRRAQLGVPVLHLRGAARPRRGGRPAGHPRGAGRHPGRGARRGARRGRRTEGRPADGAGAATARFTPG